MNLAQYAAETGIKPSEFQRKLKADHELELNHETVRRWLNGTLRPAPKHFATIEKITDGKVTRHDLWPDLFGPAQSEAAA